MNYDIDIIKSSKGRYARIMESNKGIMQLRLMEESESRLRQEYHFKEKLINYGFPYVDYLVPNNDDELSTPDRYGNMHVLRRYYVGREINASNTAEIMLSVENLAKFHKVGRKIWLDMIANESDSYHVIREDYDLRKRNRELKRVRAYVSRVSPKQKFEEIYIRHYDFYYNKALDCERKLNELIAQMDCKAHRGYCHGSYNNHNVLICRGENNYIATVGFDRFYIGNQLADLYYFARKIVEKNDYDFELLKKIIECYMSYIELNKSDLTYIYLLFTYPEKFYKLSSQYLNSSKLRLSPVLLEKLGRIIGSDEKKNRLIESYDKIFLHI